MADKARHAYGSRKNLGAAIAAGTVDAYDVLLLNGEDEAPAIGWMDRNGNPVVIAPTDDLAKLENRLETELAAKASTEALTELETQLSTKVDAAEVDVKVETAVKSEVESAVSILEQSYEKSKYELSNVPTGTLVDYRDKEIRVMCPATTEWTKQQVGDGGDANCYYAALKTYVYDDRIVGYVEHLGNQVDDEILTTFSTDERGRRYQTTWLALAKYDDATGAWTYYGKTSSVSKYIGWDYQIDWYDANGMMIASDCVRINLSNEQCHSSIEPYYIGNMMTEVTTKIDEKIEEKLAEAESSYEIIEF